jgi:hypothetical protein
MLRTIRHRAESGSILTPRAVPVSFPLTIDLSRMSSPKDRLGCSTTRVNVVVGGRGMPLSEQRTDTEAIA